MKTNENILLLADAYKYSHHKLYYPGTSTIYSYMESRGGQFNETVFYGLQYFLKHYLEGAVITKEKIDEAAAFLPQVFGRNDVFDRSKFDQILNKYGGRLPVRIKAVPEGSVIPVNNVMMTIENTDPDCFWLSNFLETLLMQVWYPSTVATLSREIRKIVDSYYKDTASSAAQAGIDFVLNDFGFRGVSSVESAGLGGSAHLLNFRGSDTIIGSVLAKNYYEAQQVYGVSVPATEHSVCTLLGEEGELEVFRHVLKSFPTGIVACVSDSFDIFRACSEYWGEELKEMILSRDGVLVIRPDSGDPVFTLLKVFAILMNKFGYTINDKGYKVLPPQVRVLQGDGVNIDMIRFIYGALKVNGISAENLVLGMGGALLQKVDRDTQKFAFKCSYAEVSGKPVDVQKSPVELDSHGQLVQSFKKSKAGKLKLIRKNDQYQTVRQESEPAFEDKLLTVFENGELTNTNNFEAVRSRAALK
ncbi:nicotinate phosphoribosyltransferase [Pseudobacter ginsenosidimutans]|uniref:Nicotinamide phosphoribosyltransferase n=1 Tax=Pseudobacter ginsenosidimutans TaxID=661488 RepID=A0A4Q7MRT9_9BACT|nr:nicotinate phosphoribosyltransferase [Pseudobacter ginsenosidimutans]QEC41720.1 nicotinate phosphoribosyltransferase [Pseudobacter ginsenosidimutans]RZS71476.1 nicotinamide phosphoribosyltransferase [Pseudobacter ginsenosidimutans]